MAGLSVGNRLTELDVADPYPVTDGILLEDQDSYLLMEDDTSYLLKEA